MTPFYVSCIVSQALSNMLGPICSSRPCKKKQKTQSSSVDVLCVGFHFPFANTTLRKRKQPDGAVTNQPYRQKKCEVAPKRTLKDRAKVANHQTRLQYSEMRTMKKSWFDTKLCRSLHRPSFRKMEERIQLCCQGINQKAAPREPNRQIAPRHTRVTLPP